MVEKTLENDLKYNIINFKQSVLLTDLILEYKLSYAEVERLVESQLLQAKEKYEKSYLVQGLASNGKEEIFTIVAENELQAALKKLENAKSNLYSVELCGGSKSLPQPLKPLTYATIALKDATKVMDTEATPKVEVKTEDKKVAQKPLQTKSEVKSVSPKDKKPIHKPLAEKGQIKKPTSPKKVNDFFKKNSTKPATKKTKTAVKANESMQLFEEEQDEQSDEEEKDKLRRELVAAAANDDNDDDDYEMTIKPSVNKRRRILDSDEDEEEQPQAKQEKKVTEKKHEKEPEIEPGTYMDEEGFVLTVKPKKQNVNNMPIRSSPRKSAAAAPKPSPIKKTPIKKTPQKKPAAKPKAKQGNIMSFFVKK